MLIGNFAPGFYILKDILKDAEAETQHSKN